MEVVSNQNGGRVQHESRVQHEKGDRVQHGRGRQGSVRERLGFAAGGATHRHGAVNDPAYRLSTSANLECSGILRSTRCDLILLHDAMARCTDLEPMRRLPEQVMANLRDNMDHGQRLLA